MCCCWLDFGTLKGFSNLNNPWTHLHLLMDQQVICAVWLEHRNFVRVPAAASSQSLGVVHLLCLAGGWRKVRLCPAVLPVPFPGSLQPGNAVGTPKGTLGGGCIAEGKEQVQI